MEVGETPHERWYFVKGRWVYVSIYQEGLYINGVQINTEEVTIVDPRWYEDDGKDENMGQWMLAAALWVILIALVIPIWEKWTW